ncbi:MAG: hypothetical protein ACM4D3_18325 [Candidatus Sericytochromatia bacterium]
MNLPTVPLVVLALELGADADRLARQLGDDVLVDRAGLRVVETNVAARLIDARAAKEAAKHVAERERRAAAAQRAAEQPARSGAPRAEEGLTAVQQVMAPVHEAKQRARDTALDAYIRGGDVAVPAAGKR